MTIVELRFIIYFVLALETSVLAYLFYKTSDGWCRKLLIAKNIMLAIFFSIAIFRGISDINGLEFIGNIVIGIAAFGLLIVQSLLINYLVNKEGDDGLF